MTSSRPVLPVRHGPSLGRYAVGTFTRQDGTQYQAVYDRKAGLSSEATLVPAPPYATYADFHHQPIDVRELAHLLNNTEHGVRIVSVQCSQSDKHGKEFWHVIVAVGASEYPIDVTSVFNFVDLSLFGEDRKAMLRQVAGYIANAVAGMVQKKILAEMEFRLLGGYL